MRYILIAAALLLAGQARAASTGFGFGSSIAPQISIGTFTPTGQWTFEGAVQFNGPVNITSATLLSAATVSALAPILGDGSSGDPLRLDSSSVTLKGQNVVEKTGDAMSGTLTLPFMILNGLRDYGARTTAELRALSCPVIPCRATNSDDFDMYTATGTAAGNWRNTRLGTGP